MEVKTYAAKHTPPPKKKTTNTNKQTNTLNYSVAEAQKSCTGNILLAIQNPNIYPSF